MLRTTQLPLPAHRKSANTFRKSLDYRNDKSHQRKQVTHEYKLLSTHSCLYKEFRGLADRAKLRKDSRPHSKTRTLPDHGSYRTRHLYRLESTIAFVVIASTTPRSIASDAIRAATYLDRKLVLGKVLSSAMSTCVHPDH
jgi:hypothetical protein